MGKSVVKTIETKALKESVPAYCFTADVRREGDRD